MRDVRYVIEPANDKGVIHRITGNPSIAGIPGRWGSWCGAIVAGIVLEADIVDGKPCRKCEAHRIKYSKWLS
jgi:hypothetical protein